ncbi:hypothetical protein NPM06_28745 [Bacillus cereus]|uniref:hypothetical protein n=1 Tax=Bacillus cereus TaxID=1396 RepID=UPI0021136CC7|nr:hypothetical protein [Bacillus cereus]
MKIYVVQLVMLEDGSHVSGLMKTFESMIRPMEGDLLDDPGFYAEPYDYSIIKISINYETDECYVSMMPVRIENMDLKVLHTYIEKLKMNGWSVIPTEEFVNGHTTVVRKQHGKSI